MLILFAVKSAFHTCVQEPNVLSLSVLSALVVMYSKWCTIYCGGIDTVLWSWIKKIKNKTSISQNVSCPLENRKITSHYTFQFLCLISVSFTLFLLGLGPSSGSSPCFLVLSMFWFLPVWVPVLAEVWVLVCVEVPFSLPVLVPVWLWSRCWSHWLCPWCH